MPRSEHGLRRAVAEGIGGFILSTMINQLHAVGLISDPFYFEILLIMNLANIATVAAMRFWGNGYLLGWMFGGWILSQAPNIMGPLEIITYFVVPILIIIWRFWKKLSGNHYWGGVY